MSEQIFGDESGANGENLVDEHSGVFCYGTIRTSTDQASADLKSLKEDAGIRAEELKMRHFRSRDRGLVLTDWLSSEADRIVVYSVQKEYMAVAKLVDNVVEELWYRSGRNIHARGSGAEMARTLYIDGARTVPRRKFQAMVRAFVAASRFDRLTDESAREVFAAARTARRSCSDRSVRDVLDEILVAEPIGAEVLRESQSGVLKTLDPLTPVITQIARRWGERLSEPLEIVLDENSLITPKWIATIVDQLRNPDTTYFPGEAVQVASIETANSKDTPGIQLADLVAGAARIATEAFLDPGSADALARDCLEVLEPLLRVESMVPAFWTSG